MPQVAVRCCSALLPPSLHTLFQHNSPLHSHALTCNLLLSRFVSEALEATKTELESTVKELAKANKVVNRPACSSCFPVLHWGLEVGSLGSVKSLPPLCHPILLWMSFSLLTSACIRQLPSPRRPRRPRP